MSSKTKVFYVGKKSQKTSPLSKRNYWLRPSIIAKEDLIGLRIEYFESPDGDDAYSTEENLSSGLHNPITLWRATQVIEELQTFEDIELCSVICSVMLNGPNIEDCPILEQLLAQVDPNLIEEIMNRKPSQEVINMITLFIIKDSLDYIAITAEIARGTIEWNSNFAELGIRHPKQQKEIQDRTDKALQPYKKWLQEYYQENDLKNDGMNAGILKNMILNAIDKDLPRVFGEATTMGISILLAEIVTNNIFIKTTVTGFVTYTQFPKQFARVAKWIAKQEHPVFWRLYVKRYWRRVIFIIKTWNDFHNKHLFEPTLEELGID